MLIYIRPNSTDLVFLDSSCTCCTMIIKKLGQSGKQTIFFKNRQFFHIMYIMYIYIHCIFMHYFCLFFHLFFIIIPLSPLKWVWDGSNNNKSVKLGLKPLLILYKYKSTESIVSFMKYILLSGLLDLSAYVGVDLIHNLMSCYVLHPCYHLL